MQLELDFYKINGTTINYFIVCKRKCWLYLQGICFEKESIIVNTAKNKHPNSEEVDLGYIKLDGIRNGKLVEYKNSSAELQASIFQTKYYLSELEKFSSIKEAELIDLKTSKKYLLSLSEKDKELLRQILEGLNELKREQKGPKPIQHTKCKSCSYFDYCYVGDKYEKD